MTPAPLTCEAVRELLVLYPYGELTFDQEEAVDTHTARCAACAAEKNYLENLHNSLDEAAVHPSMELLATCRRDLRAAMAADTRSAWRRLLDAFLPAGAFAKPVAATAIFLAGFFGAKLVPQTTPETPVARTVRFIEPAGDGALRIGYDEISPRAVEGRVDEAAIRELLLAASTSPDDPALRVDSVEALKARGERGEVRQALTRALESDPNEGVRLKALEALKPYLAEHDVRTTLTRVLMSDESATVRTQAIDLLTSSRATQLEMTGVLQDLMRNEKNDYIRERSRNALRAVNASLETF
ncbi:MAG: hypothetical protein FJW30_14195 [Acidobacteria bacterium]|nr:hypothetical protein [Acidobacteriota bacterium]